MLRRLDRYILADLARVGLLTGSVLVIVIAFGATIRPLSDDRLLSAGQTAKYILFAIVPMLQFAIPFAAGFAGTMSFHRLAADNEILAASAGGISYRRILLPVAALGLALLLVMGLLTQWVIPRFWGMLESAVAKDVTRIFQTSIERGEPFVFGDRQIFADHMAVETNPSELVDTRLVLFGVAAADIDKEGRIDKEVTANRAVVDVYRRPDATYLKLAMADAVAYDPADGVLAWAPRLDSRTIVIPSVLGDDARNMTQSELLALRRNPDSYEDVNEEKLRVVERLRDGDVWGRVDAQLEEHGRIELDGPAGTNSRFELRARRLQGGRIAPQRGENVVIVRSDGGRPVRRFEAKIARLDRRKTGPLDAPVCDIELEACTVIDLDRGGLQNTRERVRIESVIVKGADGSEDLTAVSSDELLARADRLPGDPELASRAAKLRHEISELEFEIVGRLAKRYCMAFTAPLLLLLGATLAMCLRNSPPLAVYLWAFLPSVLDLMLISSGEHMIRDGNYTGGFTMLVLGNTVLVVLIVLSYVRLARH